MSGHTPGPWKVMDGAIQCEKLNDYGNFIVVALGRDPTPQDEANLRLMAESPALLAMLLKFQAEARCYHDSCGHGEPGASAQCDSICELIPQADAVIKKTTEQ